MLISPKAIFSTSKRCSVDECWKTVVYEQCASGLAASTIEEQSEYNVGMTTRLVQAQVYRFDPKDSLDEVRSQRNADGSALLFYKSGAIVKLEEPPQYLVNRAVGESTG